MTLVIMVCTDNTCNQATYALLWDWQCAQRLPRRAGRRDIHDTRDTYDTRDTHDTRDFYMMKHLTQVSLSRCRFNRFSFLSAVTQHSPNGNSAFACW